jgi:ABC-type phosphonate transport system ATPase subunit
MPIDGSALGNVAAQQMAALERDYGEIEEAQIGAVMTIVEVLVPQRTDEQGNTVFASAVRSRYNIGDPYRAIGIIKAAEHNITETAFGETQANE